MKSLWLGGENFDISPNLQMDVIRTLVGPLHLGPQGRLCEGVKSN